MWWAVPLPPVVLVGAGVFRAALLRLQCTACRWSPIFTILKPGLRDRHVNHEPRSSMLNRWQWPAGCVRGSRADEVGRDLFRGVGTWPSVLSERAHGSGGRRYTWEGQRTQLTVTLKRKSPSYARHFLLISSSLTTNLKGVSIFPFCR